MGQETFKSLFETFGLGPLSLNNRLVMNAMTTGSAGPGGTVTDRLIEYYAARAAGGVGMVTVELAGIHPQIYHVNNALGIFGDHLIMGLQKLTRRLHDEGSATSIQIGIYFRQHVNGFPRYSTNPSVPDDASHCIELNRDEIRFLTGLFADAASRAQLAGFDAVEVHACHGCLLSEFLSPYWNKRTDEYGGNLENRCRFALEILTEIRERVGLSYPVLFRISGSEFSSEGISPEDAVSLAQTLEKAGVTAVNVSGGLAHKNHIAIAPCHVPRGIFLPLSESIKKGVDVPVIAGNSLTPLQAVQALEWGQADLIGLGRPLVADAEWPVKLKEGRLREIRPCIRCNQGCIGGLRDPRRGQIGCLYNPSVGREGEASLEKSKLRKRVGVIGGGPAGCEVARVASLRGHEVILLETTRELGGQFKLAAVPPGKEDFRQLIDFYQWELRRLGVDIRLETSATPELLHSLNADTHVLAAGSRAVKPSVPGVDQVHVHMAQDVLAEKAKVEEGPVAVLGGGATGLETARVLSGKGLQVTVIEILDSPGIDISGIGIREFLLFTLGKNNVKILTGQRAMVIESEAVIVSDRPLIGGGRETRIPAKSVALALGQEPETTLLDQDIPSRGTWHRVGDCRSPGNALTAIHDAFELACKI
jgi:2,4-dienoyl-CoA reductase-like NADH-dependent reductase (Old Yellow Enzyme family)/thioredoxin reductase